MEVYRKITGQTKNNDKIFDKQFIKLSNEKLSKTGDIMLGSLNMNYNKLLNLDTPTDLNEPVTKRYCDDNCRSKVKIGGDVMQGDLDLDWYNLSSVRFPFSDYDAVNKLYVRGPFINTSEIDDFYTIIKIGEVLVNKLNSEGYLKKYLLPLGNSLHKVASMTYDCAEIFGADLHKSVKDMITDCPFFLDLKVNILNIIQKLGKPDFELIKLEYANKDLILNVEDKHIIKKHKRFIKKQVEKLPGNIVSNEEVKLLILKNELLLDMGFLYFIEDLLTILLYKKIVLPTTEKPWERLSGRKNVVDPRAIKSVA